MFDSQICKLCDTSATRVLYSVYCYGVVINTNNTSFVSSVRKVSIAVVGVLEYASSADSN